MLLTATYKWLNASDPSLKDREESKVIPKLQTCRTGEIVALMTVIDSSGEED